MRFALIGVASTLAYAAVYWVLRGPMSAQWANAMALLLTAVGNTAANRWFTFGVRGRSGRWRHQAQGLVVFAVGLAVTSGSLALLGAVAPGASHGVELVVLTVANIVATILRFLMYRAWVFGRQRASAAAPSVARTELEPHDGATPRARAPAPFPPPGHRPPHHPDHGGLLMITNTPTHDTWWSPTPDQPNPRPDGSPGGSGQLLADPLPEAARVASGPQAPIKRSPRWARWALAGLLAVTAVLYLWDLSANGWANSYYSAAVQAGGASWKAWFFGSLDAANSITVDKTTGLAVADGPERAPLRLELVVDPGAAGTARRGERRGRSIATVRRWFGPSAGLIAGAVLALTPVATLMFRFNNPDALLVFLLVCAAWAMGRATEKASLRWIMLAGAFVGFAFLAKMMQAFLVLPGFVAMYAARGPDGPAAADRTSGRRFRCR